MVAHDVGDGGGWEGACESHLSGDHRSSLEKQGALTVFLQLEGLGIWDGTRHEISPLQTHMEVVR